MLSQHFLNTLNGRYVIDYQMGINLNSEAFKLDIRLKVATDITHLYELVGIFSIATSSLIWFNQNI